MAVPPAFVPGLELAGDFYAGVVRPLLADEFPGLRYAAALLGPGSEVAGFDTQRSTDHDWGPRLQLLLPDEPSGALAGAPGDIRAVGAAGVAEAITAMLTRRLPGSFRGYPVRFSLSGEPASAARHHVRVAGLGGWIVFRWFDGGLTGLFAMLAAALVLFGTVNATALALGAWKGAARR